ncbi:uncharacterized protein BDV14DRAFT_198435 [Aspergillus stella-maris]|uniref:uncharacterized protein n=1 Tax=Aspergillus stella-maris TaxID=1810926 RepID=UPI003CCD562A
MLTNDNSPPENRGHLSSDMPSTHWVSPAFIGTYSAMGLTFMGTLGGFALFAPLQNEINNDLGPSSNIEYAHLLNVILSAISIQIVGRMSDVFGRRWFFIIGTGIGLLASILGATAHSITQIIVSQALFGTSLGVGDSFFWVVSEIVPMKWRYLAVSGQYIYTFPGNPLAAKVAVAFQGSKVAAISASIIAAPMLVAAATDPLNRQLTLGLVATGCLFIGALEGVSLIASTFPLKTQGEIGTGGGMVGTTRQFLGSVATAVFTTVLRNREATTIPRYVNPSVIEAGLPPSSSSALISGLNGATPLNNETVPGYNSTIADIADRSWKMAHAQSYKTVFYVSFGFFAAALILSWFVPTFDRDKEDFVAGEVQRGAEEAPNDPKE